MSVDTISCHSNADTFLAVGNYYSHIHNTHTTQSKIYKWFNATKEFKLYGEIETRGVTQIQFFEDSQTKQIFVSVANERGACAIYVLDVNVAGRFREYHVFGGPCTMMNMFEQNATGAYSIS